MILKFPDVGARSDFLEIVQAERPHLLPLLRVSRILPHIQLGSVTRADTTWIASHISPVGKMYDDLKMDMAAS